MRPHFGIVIAAALALAGAAGCATTRPHGAGDVQTRPAPAPALPAIATAPSSDRPAVTTTSSGIACGEGAAQVRCTETLNVKGGAPAFQPLDSASFDADDLRIAGPDAASWIAFARRQAGVFIGDERVYVNGMPAATLPPAATIARLAVNADPFAAEFSDVGEIRFDVDLRAPDRKWRFSAGIPGLNFGGGSPLAKGDGTTSRHTSAAVSGPVPGLPVALAFQAADSRDVRRTLFAVPGGTAVIPGEDGSDITSTARNAALSLTYSGRRGEVRLSTGTSRMRVDNGGIGGINLPSTRQHLDTANANVRVTWRTVAAGRLVRGGATVVRDRLSSSAPSERPYEVVTGEITRGSNERSAEHRRSLAIHLKQVVDSPSSRRPWNVGFEARRVGLDEARTMNPFGRLQSEAPGAPHGFWTVTRTPLAGTAVATTAAVFAEQTLVASSWARVRAGIRSDWQQGDGVAIAPRVSMTATRGRLQFTGGAGLFVQPWTADTFAEVTQRSGGLTYLIPGVNIEEVALRDPASGSLLTTRLDPRYARRQDLVVRAALQRRTGPVTVGVEHTWTRGHRLTGAARTREAGAVTDVVRSDRDLRRHQTHARLQAAWRGHSLVGHYQFARSFDNSDGPFVQPATGDDAGTEWGPSRGIPRHAVQVAASVRLPARVRMAVTFDARVGVPFSAITGRDSEGLGTFMDRGGLPRNANRLPPTRGIGAHVSRRVHMKIGREFVVDLGARAENLTNHTNVTSVGRVLESSMFGRPLGTAPGRSVRFWATLGR